MKTKLFKVIVFCVLSSPIIFCQKNGAQKPHTLVITSDFNSVRRCKTLTDLNNVAQIMISAKPNIIALDVASPDLVNYSSKLGHFLTGSNFDALMQKGYDPYAIMVDTLRKHEITVMANIRMNDHHGRPVQWSPWERENKEWSLAKDNGARDWKSIGALRHMNYAIKGVRDYRFSILKEITKRFNINGIQLDFGRTAPFVSEPKQENGKYVTEYIREVRKLLNETALSRNLERMYLGIILPWDYEFCKNEGLEVKTWIEEGLVDYISPGEWYYADWNIPLDKWRKITSGTDCKLYPFTPGNVSSYQEFEYGERSVLGPNRVLDEAKIRAIADNFMFQKPDGFAFYNFYTFDYGQFYSKIRTWTNPYKTKSMSKHYYNCRKLMYHANERETFDIGVAFKRQLLKVVGDRVQIPFRFSTKLSGEEAIIRFAFKYMSEQDEIAIRVNGRTIIPDLIYSKTVEPDSCELYNVTIWESKILMPPLKMGKNEIELKLKKQVSTNKRIEVGEFEIRVSP